MSKFIRLEFMDGKRVGLVFDFLEKFSVAGLSLAVFQGNWLGVISIPF